MSMSQNKNVRWVHELITTYYGCKYKRGWSKIVYLLILYKLLKYDESNTKLFIKDSTLK